MLRPGRLAAVAALAVAGALATAAAAAAPALAGEVSASAVHRRLVESAPDGRRLVTESGELLRLEAAGQRAFDGGAALRALAGVAAGRLDYRGQTQSGAPLQTHSGHRDLELALEWRPLAPAAWGEAWLGLHALQQRRRIASTPLAQGLDETSNLLLPSLRWSKTYDAAGWRWEPAVELRASVRHRLEVDFGGLFDSAQMRGGHRREFVLGLDASPAGSAWRFGIAWSHARQSASPQAPLQRAGLPAGTVRQPRIGIDDLALRITRAF